MLNNHNLESVYKYFIPPEGEGFKEIFSNYLSAFPDLHCMIDHIIAEEEKVAVFATWYGTQKVNSKAFQLPTNVPSLEVSTYIEYLMGK
jgi:predicted ester cyclase